MSTAQDISELRAAAVKARGNNMLSTAAALVAEANRLQLALPASAALCSSYGTYRIGHAHSQHREHCTD